MVILGLGSNLGDRKHYLRVAVERLVPLVSDMKLSHVYESAAVLLPGAPAEWNKPFLNMAISGHATLAPQALLYQLKQIETAIGRTPGKHWAPREIDLDILAIDDLCVSEVELHLPHPELLKRDFALVPLAEVAPDWKYPVEGSYEGTTAARLVQLLKYAPGANLRDVGSLGDGK